MSPVKAFIDARLIGATARTDIVHINKGKSVEGLGESLDLREESLIIMQKVYSEDYDKL